MGKPLWIILLAVLCLVLWGFWQKDALAPHFFAPRTPSLPVSSTKAVAQRDQEVVADGLAIPWELVFLPDGSMLVTERPGNLVKITEDKQVIPISGVAHRGEGGLLGLALHPDFARNKFIYVYFTTSTGTNATNTVERYALEGATVTNRTTIVENIPGSALHDGGRIAFGPDKKLYIATGDAGVASNAQDTNNLAGKILRVNDDGSLPSDNPFGNAVYSYGHRNVQGIAWDSGGTLWATEHGRSSPKSGFDEVNRIEKGKNYGWPTIQGDEVQAGMENPVAHSGENDTWAPAGMVIRENDLFFTGLRGQSLYRGTLSGGKVENLTAYFREQFGRLRAVVLGPDKQLYILTNNTDGRGKPKQGDDKIIRINPDAL